MLTRTTTCISVLAFAACGSEAVSPDAGPCWPIDQTSPGGEVQLGHKPGGSEFTEVEDGQDLQIETGPQGGFHFSLSARIVGLDPGDPQDSLSEKNPRTRFMLMDEDRVPVRDVFCPTRLTYLDREGPLELKFSLPILFENETVADYFDQTVILFVEVIDSNFNYATDERRVIARTPDLLLPDAGVGSIADAATPADAAP